MTAREEIMSPGAAACADEQAVPDSGTRPAAEAQGERAKRYGGLDVLRILAILLVTAQHSLSLSDRDEWPTWQQINIGQLGVAIFLILSGLAAGQDHRPPVAWLARRLARIMPAYWL